MQRGARLVLHVFSSFKNISHVRLRVSVCFSGCGYKNMPEVLGPLANICYKCFLLDKAFSQ